MRDIAEEKYHGEEGYNCAQAILSTFKDQYSVDQNLIDEYKKFGGGRAEGNLCGALYAAQTLETDPQKQQEIAEQFASVAGSTKCREIRMGLKLSCKGCVGETADILTHLAK